MFGPERERPCPLCTNLLGAWEGNAADIGQAHLARRGRRSPIERLIAWKRERGWKSLRPYSDLDGAYSRDYFGLLPDGSEIPAFNVFTRRDGTIRHFWSGEMTGPLPTLARTREAPPTQPRCGWCWTPRRKGGAGIGIRS